jgi:Domain of unknown function (DUF4157)
VTREAAHEPVTPSPKPARRASTRGPSPAGATPALGHELLRVAERRATSAATQGTADAVASLPRGNVAAELDAARGGGEPLSQPARGELERGIDADFAAVRTHRGARADALAAALGATAFTAGTDVFLHRSAPHPTTAAGRGLLAHELVHVLQQAAGPVEGRSGPGGLRVSDPGDRHERAAARAGERVGSGEAVELGLAVTAPQGPSGVVVQRQTPAAPSETSIGERVAELERRQSVTEARQASVDQDARWRGDFGARFSSCTQAILRVSGALQHAQDGFNRAQVEQAEFDTLAMQLLIAAASVGFAAGFEPLLSGALGRMGMEAKAIKATVEKWENPSVQAVGTMSNLVPATLAVIGGPDPPAATVVPTGDPFAHLTANLEAIERHKQSMELAFGARAGQRAGASDEQVLAFDLAAQEQAYAALLAGLTAASAGVESLKSADELAVIIERHLWAGWIKQHGAVAIGDTLSPVGQAPPPRDPDARTRPQGAYSVAAAGAYVGEELNAIGVSRLAGVSLSTHWFLPSLPIDWPYKLLTWAFSYRESAERAALDPARPTPTE